MTDKFEWANYILDKKSIGRGSFSKVYYGYHKESLQKVAVKKILFSKLSDDLKSRIISEINILTKIDNINIMKLYNYKFDGDYILLITEYCEDGDLSKWINKPNKSNVEILDIFIQIIAGIKYLQDNNIIHRDIKPQNILLDNNIIKICDFGFSTMYKTHMDMFSTICGTPLYMCPEVLNMKKYTIKSEIWSLGILFYIIIYNSHPYGNLSSIEDYKEKINNEIIYQPINLFEVSECNEQLISIIKSMLAIDYEARPNIDTILHNLENISEIYNYKKDSINNFFFIDEL